jgi:hypothetical protein
MDLAAMAENRPQALRRNPEGQFQLYRVGDALASRNIHAAIYDSLRGSPRISEPVTEPDVPLSLALIGGLAGATALLAWRCHIWSRGRPAPRRVTFADLSAAPRRYLFDVHDAWRATAAQRPCMCWQLVAS